MKIITEKIDYKKKVGFIDLITESPDDLYFLSNIIEKKDILRSKTTRKINLEGKDAKKVTVLMDIYVEELEVNLQNNVIFVKGRIKSDHEHIKIGSYHTIDIGLNTRLSITKEDWSEFCLGIIQEMKAVPLALLFFLFYDKECIVISVTKFYSKILQRISIKNGLKPFFDYIISNITELKVGVICTFKQEKVSITQQISKHKDLSKYAKFFCEINVPLDLRNTLPTTLTKKLILDEKNKFLIQKIENQDVTYEYDRFMKNLAGSTHLTCIGIAEMEEALEYGCIDTVIITYEKIKSFDINERKLVDQLLGTVKGQSGGVYSIPEESLYGDSIKEMGGVVCNLKFAYK